jgi:hypothetical protein
MAESTPGLAERGREHKDLHLRPVVLGQLLAPLLPLPLLVLLFQQGHSSLVMGNQLLIGRRLERLTVTSVDVNPDSVKSRADLSNPANRDS